MDNIVIMNFRVGYNTIACGLWNSDEIEDI